MTTSLPLKDMVLHTFKTKSSCKFFFKIIAHFSFVCLKQPFCDLRTILSLYILLEKSRNFPLTVQTAARSLTVHLFLASTLFG